MTEPSSFRERLELFYSRAIVWAGVLVGVGVSLILLLLAFGGWPEEYYGTIINFLGALALGGGAFMVIVIVLLGLGGPAAAISAVIGKFSVESKGR